MKTLATKIKDGFERAYRYVMFAIIGEQVISAVVNDNDALAAEPAPTNAIPEVPETEPDITDHITDVPNDMDGGYDGGFDGGDMGGDF